MIDDLRALVAEFQQQTNSLNILQFITWLENKDALLRKLVNRTPQAIANTIVKDLDKKNKEEKKDDGHITSSPPQG